jgi:hypothetical protein
MSLNKILNRPLFRQTALKKGVLKPVRARVGTMVGLPVGGPAAYNPMRVPAINQQGFFGRNVKPAMQRTGRFLKNSFGIRPLISSTGTYMLSDDILTKLGVTGPLKTGINFAAGVAGATPYGRPIGYAYSGLKGLSALADKVRRDNPNSMIGLDKNDPTQNTFDQITGGVLAGEPLATGDRAINPFRKLDPSRPRGRGATKRALEERKKLAQAEGSELGIVSDQLTAPQNEIKVGNENIADLNKLVKNKRGEILKETIEPQTVAMQGDTTGSIAPYIVDGGLTGPVGIEGQDISIKPPAPVKETPEQVAQKTFNAAQDGKGTEQPIGGKRYTTNLIQRAKEIRAEMGMEPQGDTARSMFLSQLAAGLMAGTSKQRGLAGAIQIFGQALGPAVSNYGVMKLKQNELENKSMETYLGFAFDEMKLFNEAAAGEPFKGELGIIQFIDDNGNTINVKGRQTAAGTMEFATGQVDQRGNEIYAAVSSQANVPGFGKVNQFLDKKTVNTETMKIGDTLSNRYKTFKITNDVLDTIAAQPESVGPAGAINLFKTRFGSALNDLGFSFGGGKSEARAAAAAYRAQIEASDLDEKSKKRLLKDTDFDKLYKDAEKRIESRTPGKVDDETLESLAVAETTLVYALANSFKDKDRLTARDVAAAEKLVNLFTLTRGSSSVAASIKAIGQQLQDDITRYENDYRRVGGLERTLQNMRVQNQFRLQSGKTVTDQFIKKLDDAGLLEEFNK